MYYKSCIVFLFVEFLVCVQPSFEQNSGSVRPGWNYTYFDPDCDTPGYSGDCEDIRTCEGAAVSVAMGGWPVVCGWVVENVLPKVCCWEPLVLGVGLMRKASQERDRETDCGLAVWEIKLSPTEINFRKLKRDLPSVHPCSDLSRYDPPLDIDCSWAVRPTGSSPATQGKYPWMVAIMANGKHICGGSIIDRTHILSAAHCFTSENGKLDARRYIVHAGDIDMYNGSPINVTNILLHERYIAGQYYHDIAILSLEKEVHPSLRQICLPSPKLALKSLAGEKTTILGWGHTSYMGAGTNKLQEVVDIPVLTTEKCRRAYRRFSRRQLPYGITNDFVCAGLEEGGKDACQSDSGGPLMYKIVEGPYYSKWALVGIVSFGFRCGEPGIPGVYTRVSTHMSWILRNTKE